MEGHETRGDEDHGDDIDWVGVDRVVALGDGQGLGRGEEKDPRHEEEGGSMGKPGIPQYPRPSRT
jgi:hypothetical protein